MKISQKVLGEGGYFLTHTVDTRVHGPCSVCTGLLVEAQDTELHHLNYWSVECGIKVLKTTRRHYIG